MIKLRAIAVIVAAMAFYIIQAAVGIPGAHAATEPPGASIVGLGAGDACLTAMHNQTTPGTPVVVSKCNPVLTREQWSFVNGALSPWANSSSVVSVSPDGHLVLANRDAAFTTWTYGPSHELTTPTLTGTAFLTWMPGTGRVPWISTAQGAGQTVYVFTKAG
jgi:hypothetical protein